MPDKSTNMKFTNSSALIHIIIVNVLCAHQDSRPTKCEDLETQLIETAKPNRAKFTLVCVQGSSRVPLIGKTKDDFSRKTTDLNLSVLNHIQYITLHANL